MADINSSLSLIILYVNGLKLLTVKVSRMEKKIYYANSNNKRDVVTIVPSGE